ncbi:CBO0543 family protein [Paenibacillus piri]|uniref:Uncharacterized protein n=1 Tax=Paenibacillus piri TaxID=2547395 RepID=A0A4R5KN68_9BACL|nr:CBO0543 family protein [Paenibacillus piri]TDF97099.1 hypothetical protein E1757_14755 [Paenibacillus piri]
MTVDWVWYSLSCLVIIILFWRFVDWRRSRRIWIGLFAMQTITWGVGLTLVELHWIEFPVRVFPDATRQNFIAAYFIYPCLFVLYDQCYPRGGRLKQWIYTAAYAAASSGWEYVMSTSTHILKYHHWNPLCRFVLAAVSLLLCRWLVIWMFKRQYPVRSAEHGGYE